MLVESQFLTERLTKPAAQAGTPSVVAEPTTAVSFVVATVTATAL